MSHGSREIGIRPQKHYAVVLNHDPKSTTLLFFAAIRTAVITMPIGAVCWLDGWRYSNDGVSGLATGRPAAAQASKPPTMDCTLR